MSSERKARRQLAREIKKGKAVLLPPCPNCGAGLLPLKKKFFLFRRQFLCPKCQRVGRLSKDFLKKNPVWK